jgi:hypothetical protein
MLSSKPQVTVSPVAVLALHSLSLLQYTAASTDQVQQAPDLVKYLAAAIVPCSPHPLNSLQSIDFTPRYSEGWVCPHPGWFFKLRSLVGPKL